MGVMDRLEVVILRHSELTALMATADLSANQYAEYSREFAELSPVVEKTIEMKSLQKELSELDELVGVSGSDPELKELAELEREELREKLPKIEEALRVLLLPKDVFDGKNVMLEIRAGTGGDEAALFAGDLMRMYQRYAELNGWQTEYLNLSETELGGVKEAVISIIGKGVFSGATITMLFFASVSSFGP